MLKQSDSRVEIKGFEAILYDRLMDILTFGTYPFFIRKAIKNMNIQKQDILLELGSGTGRNICLMNKYSESEIRGFDIGEIMLAKSKKNCKKYSNTIIEKASILDPLHLKNHFDKILISFVFHGFTQKNRLKILDNAYNALKKGSRFFILDYNLINLEEASVLVKFFYKKIECPLAEDFIKQDWKTIFAKHKFEIVNETFYYKNNVRLLELKKI